MLETRVREFLFGLSITPTQEQEIAIAQAQKLQPFKIKAYAGTGKTSTLTMISRVLGDLMGKKGLYLAFNRAIAKEAQGKFSNQVVCKTFHGLAFAKVPKYLSDKIKNPRNFPKELAARYGLKEEQIKYGQNYLVSVKDCSLEKYRQIISKGGKRYLSPQFKMQLINDAIIAFCKSDSRVLDKSHFRKLSWLDDEGFEYLISSLLPVAQKHWDALIGKNDMNIAHDVYVKYWALSEPQIEGFDYIMMDESQDMDRLMSTLLEKQKTPVIYVGDIYQSIYGWRGAVNTLKDLDLPEVTLTKSFRFGEQIANHANLLLSLLGESKPLVGHEPIQSKVILDHKDTMPVDAILCRTNKGAFYELIKQSNAFPSRKFALMADIAEIRNWMLGAKSLMCGEPVYHPDLSCFANWVEVIEYSELNKADNEFQYMVRLLDQFENDCDEVLKILDMVSTNPKEADCIITTVHKSKGLEWDNVLISDDFELALMTDKFEGTGKVKNSDDSEVYLENWNAIAFPSSLKLYPLGLNNEMLESRLDKLPVLNKKIADQKYRITEMSEEELRLIYVALTRAKKNLYGAAFGDLLILIEKLRHNLD